MDACPCLEDLVRVDERVRSLGIHVAYTVSWRALQQTSTSRPLEEEVARLVEYVRGRYALDSLKHERMVRAYRDFFWRLGVDPTKTRPASEALVRRALKGQFPMVSPVVDAGNIASAYTLVPIGMYDLGRVLPPLTIRYSSGGEVFRPIGGREEVLGSGVPVLADARGTVVHVYPHRDSIEACVTEGTSTVLTIAAGVPGVSKEELLKAVRMTVELLKKVGWESCSNVAYRT